MVKKTDYNTKVKEIENKLNNHNHDKYIDAQEFNNLASNAFNEKFKKANLVVETDFDNAISNNAKNTDIDKYGYSGYGTGSDRRSSV